MKIRPGMVVHKELIGSLIDENFIDANAGLLLEELRRKRGGWGLDADAVIASAKKAKRGRTTSLIESTHGTVSFHVAGKEI